MTHPLHLLAFVSLVVAASILFVISVRIGLRGRRTFLVLSLLLGTFSGVHSLYHLAEYLNMVAVADWFLLPVSALLFTIFSLYYMRSSSEQKTVAKLEEMKIGA